MCFPAFPFRTLISRLCVAALSLFAAWSPSAWALQYDPNILPKGREYFQLRDNLNNARVQFEKEKTGRVAFLGGSIAAAPGWREPLMRYLEKRFPETKFEFIGAGPDAGILEVSCDGGPTKKIDTFTAWSGGLYLAWAVMLEDELAPGRHAVRVKTSEQHHPKSVGTGLYVFRILEN